MDGGIRAGEGRHMAIKRCVTCAHWKPDRAISGLLRTGGKCPYKGDTKLDDSCWFWTQCSLEQEESRRKAGLIDG